MKIIQLDTNEFAAQPTMGELLGAVSLRNPGVSVTKDSIVGHGSNSWVVCYTAHEGKAGVKRVAVVKWIASEADRLFVTHDFIA